MGEGPPTDAQSTVKKLSPSTRIVWVSTRRCFEAADVFAANLIGRYLLAEVIKDKDCPFHEMSTAHLVVIEAPPVAQPLFEHHLLGLVQKIRAMGPQVMLVVQPSVRRRSIRCLWAHKWNHLNMVPFKLYQTCSCKMGNNTPGCHLTCFVGCSTPLKTMACNEVPTVCASAHAAVLRLGLTLNSLFPAVLPSAPQQVWPPEPAAYVGTGSQNPEHSAVNDQGGRHISRPPDPSQQNQTFAPSLPLDWRGLGEAH